MDDLTIVLIALCCLVLLTIICCISVHGLCQSFIKVLVEEEMYYKMKTGGGTWKRPDDFPRAKPVRRRP